MENPNNLRQELIDARIRSENDLFKKLNLPKENEHILQCWIAVQTYGVYDLGFREGKHLIKKEMRHLLGITDYDEE